MLSSGFIFDRDLTSDTKEAMGWLENVGFVFSELEGNNNDRVFYPTEPDLLAASFNHRCEWGLPPFGYLGGENCHGQEAIATLNRCAKELIADSTQPKRVPKDFIFLEGTERISNFIVRLIEQSSDFFGMSATEWASNLPLIWAALVKRIGEGLRYRRLAGEGIFVAFGHEINKRDVLEVGVNLRILQESQLNPIFYLATTPESEICLTFNDVQARLAGRREATSFANKVLVTRFREIAEAKWEAAVPAATMFRFMDELREDYLKKVQDTLGAQATEVAVQIFDRGVFADFRGCGNNEHVLLEKLNREGLVLQKDIGIGTSNVVPNVLGEVSKFLEEVVRTKETQP
jgi:hypothetical protein